MAREGGNGIVPPVDGPGADNEQVSPSTVSPPTILIPSVIAERFQVLRRIGGGSFGEIYEGRDTLNGEQVGTLNLYVLFA